MNGPPLVALLDQLLFHRCVQLDIKSFLEKVYGLEIDKVRTCNYEGKKKRTKHGYHRASDYKKAYVILKDPPPQQ